MIGPMTDGGAAQSADQRLEHAAQARHEAEGLRRRLEAATLYADQTTVRVQEARDRLVDETEDVEKLESLSWTRILMTLRGAQLTALERETAEREAARYAVADAETRDEVAWRDVAGIQAQLDELGDVDATYVEALTAKEEWVSGHDAGVAAQLAALAERRGVLSAEAREAYEAGAAALDLLTHAQQLLGSAGSWSTWDTFGGGGLLTDMVKYDKLDQVSEVLRAADIALGQFSRELADLEVAGVGGVEVDGMTRTFDVFFDNIFTDLAVRSRIRDAESRVEHSIGAVTRTLERLNERGRALAAELVDLTEQREDLLRA